MQSKIFKLLSISLLVISIIFISSCKPDDPTLAADGWNGNWKIPEGFPPANQPTSGTIHPSSDSKQLTISGELFGLNESFKIVANVNNTKATFNKEGAYKISGTATLIPPSKIIFNITITENEEPRTYTKEALKVS